VIGGPLRFRGEESAAESLACLALPLVRTQERLECFCMKARTEDPQRRWLSKIENRKQSPRPLVPWTKRKTQTLYTSISPTGKQV
jgi:hypothetical protein